MIRIRPAAERGHANHGWLDTYHTFSFGGYYDPEHTGFRTLRVINDDTVEQGHGFGTHSHDNMEIVSYVTEGALEHRDNMGNGSVLRPGDVQRMSAGTGITHSELNHSPTEQLRFLQIWILPETRGITPDYEEKHFTPEEKLGHLRLIVSPDGRDGSLHLHQDAAIYAAVMEPRDVVKHHLQAGRHAWVQVLRGRVSLNGHELSSGDGAAVSAEPELALEGLESAELLLFNLN